MPFFVVPIPIPQPKAVVLEVQTVPLGANVVLEFIDKQGTPQRVTCTAPCPVPIPLNLSFKLWAEKDGYIPGQVPDLRFNANLVRGGSWQPNPAMITLTPLPPGTTLIPPDR